MRNYAEQLHVEMVRNNNLYEAWSQHFVKHGDSNVVTTVLAAMKLARSNQYVLDAAVITMPPDNLNNPVL